MSIALATLTMLASQAAPSAADLADARCAAALTAASDQTDAAADKAGLDGAMMFYLGKIVGRSGSAAVKPAIEAAAQSIEDPALAAIAERCATDVEKTVDSW